ncbi:MAG: helix-turn-helix domain-containing protein [Porticoccaceae bacterium]
MFYDRFEQLCKARGVSPNKACLEMGFSRSLAAKWKNMQATPHGATLQTIAAYFGVPVDALLAPGAGDEKSLPHTVEGNAAAQEIIARFARLTPENQDKVFEYALLLLKSQGSEEA